MMLRFSDDKRANILMARLPGDVLRILIQYKAFIAGGAIACLFSLGRRPKDYDVYFRTEQDFGNAVNAVIGILERAGYGYVMHSPKWYTIKLGDGVCMDFIGFDDALGEPEEVIAAFDFTACMGAFDIVNNVFYAGAFFRRDNETRRLIYNVHSKNRPNSFIRMVRYIEKYGYTIQDMEIRHMFHNIFAAEMERRRASTSMTATECNDEYTTYYDEAGKCKEDTDAQNVNG